MGLEMRGAALLLGFVVIVVPQCLAYAAGCGTVRTCSPDPLNPKHPKCTYHTMACSDVPNISFGDWNKPSGATPSNGGDNFSIQLDKLIKDQLSKVIGGSGASA